MNFNIFTYFGQESQSIKAQYNIMWYFAKKNNIDYFLIQWVYNIHNDINLIFKEDKIMLEMYRCEHCGNIVIMAYNGGGKMICCGEEMKLLEANTSDAAGEKHVPVVTVDGNKVIVKVGEVEHPMVEEHFIGSILLETNNQLHTRWMKPGEAPVAEFILSEDEKPVSAYEYCTLHGLWKKDV